MAAILELIVGMIPMGDQYQGLQDRIFVLTGLIVEFIKEPCSVEQFVASLVSGLIAGGE